METSVTQIRSAVGRVLDISDDAMLSPSEIVSIVKNKALLPSVFPLYRVIKRGDLKATNLATEEVPRYVVRGRDLKKFFSVRYGKL